MYDHKLNILIYSLKVNTSCLAFKASQLHNKFVPFAAMSSYFLSAQRLYWHRTHALDKRDTAKGFFWSPNTLFFVKLTSFWKWSYLTLASPFGQPFGDVSHLWKEFRPQGQVEASPLDDPRSQKHQVYSLRQVLPKRSKKVDPAHKHTSQHQAIEVHALQLRHRCGHTPGLFILHFM